MNDFQQHCPGLEPFKSVKDILPVEITCKKCGTVTEVFSDEVEKTHLCRSCKEVLDLRKALG